MSRLAKLDVSLTQISLTKQCLRTVFEQCKAKECFEKCPPSSNVCDVGCCCVCTWLFVLGRAPPMNTCNVPVTGDPPSNTWVYQLAHAICQPHKPNTFFTLVKIVLWGQKCIKVKSGCIFPSQVPNQVDHYR